MWRVLTMLFRKKTKYQDKLEERLDIISDLTRDLERPDFNRLVDALKSIFEARQKLKGVKTTEEKDLKDINDAEKSLYLETD